jgi:hypothetical protein
MAVCKINLGDASTVSCQDMSSCDIKCDIGCVVTCAATATCSVNCGVDGTTPSTTCPDGRKVCGQAC